MVLTGSELVTGVIADANGPWLAHELTALGFEVAQLLVVGDRPDDLAAALRAADVGHKAYYRVPAHRQPAMAPYAGEGLDLPGTEEAARAVVANRMG